MALVIKQLQKATAFLFAEKPLKTGIFEPFVYPNVYPKMGDFVWAKPIQFNGCQYCKGPSQGQGKLQNVYPN
ncbi:MAG: hypothetical protein II358_01215 [Tidjanibacter sp.]|nr:hypothetical protein [Tidjanibacter sp.]